MIGDNFLWDPDQHAFKGETSDQFFSTLHACEITTFNFNMGKKDDESTSPEQADSGTGAGAPKPGVNKGLPAGVKQGASFQRPKSGGSAGGGSGVGGAKGKASLGSLSITKFLDSASTEFYRFCATGDIIPTLNIAIRKSGGDRLMYLQYCFRANQVTAVSWSGGEGQGRPVETLTLEFKAMAMAYYRQSSGASLETDWGVDDPGAQHLFTWNVTQTGDDQQTLIINGEDVPEPFLTPHNDAY
ncbi:MAG TPA: type VI secretion system tube protein Hcp [Bryobacteraceae bacterium]|jgi:type VI protein secretion system component Hcp|nr:type VI secretion system tube protein Hcp [Bryobacteraceae bacterium]